MGKDGSFYLVDINGNVSPWEWDTKEKHSDYLCSFSFSDGLCRVSKDGLYGYMDIDGNLVIPFEWEYAEDFSEGLAVVGKDGKEWYVNTKGEAAFQYRYSGADSFDNGYATVYQDGMVNIIDLSGNIVARDVGLVHRIVPIGDSMLALGVDAVSAGQSFTGDNDLCDYMVVTLGGELVLGDATPLNDIVGDNRVYFPNFPVGSMLEFYELGGNNRDKYGYLNTSTGEVLWCNGHIWKDGILYLYNDGVISAYDMEGNPLPHLTVDLNR